MRILDKALIAGATLLAAGACSLIYPLDADQCSKNSDCPSGSSCDPQQHICLLPVTEMGGGGSGGSGGDGGSGGTGNTGGCTTHAECVNEHSGEAYICRDGTCVGLRNNTVTTDGGAEGQCIVVAGEENLKQPQGQDVFVFGAFSLIPPESPSSSPFTLNYAFAIKEFTNNGGIIINGKRTLPVAVVCDANPEYLTQSFDHLVNTVGVQAIITPLSAVNLRAQFERIYDNGDGKKVLMISPFESDSSLTQLTDEGLVWHMLPDSSNMAPPYVPLVERLETYLRTHFWLAQETDPIRVALVVATDNRYLADVGDLLANGGELIDETPVDPLRFNDKTPAQNGAATYRRFVTSYSSDLENPPDMNALASEIKAFAPHIVVSAAGPEFIKLMNVLESIWGQIPVPMQGDDPPLAQNRPFYVLSPFQRRPELQELAVAAGGSIPLRQRIVGINPASAEDLTLYQNYYNNFSMDSLAKSCGDPCVGTENFYDPVYFIMYAAAASGNQPITAAALAQSMPKLIDGDRSFNVGGLDIPAVDEYLSGAPIPGNRRIQLQGTLGPPNFHAGSGTRGGFGSVYCMLSDTSLAFDVLRYDGTSKTLYEPEAGDAGPPPVTIDQCVPGF